MPIYRTTFERFNFLFEPAAEQKVDIFFEYDGDEDDLGSFEKAAWGALWKQFPNECDSSFPEGCGGWSSWLGGRKYEKVEIDRTPDLGTPGEGKPRIGEIISVTDMRGKVSTLRVDSFYKVWTPPKRVGIARDAMIDDIIDEIKAKEYAGMTEEKRKWKDLEFKVVACTRDEAEFVGGAGVAWSYYRLQDVNVVGLVPWDPATIVKERERWDARVECSAAFEPATFTRYWEFKK